MLVTVHDNDLGGANYKFIDWKTMVNPTIEILTKKVDFKVVRADKETLLWDDRLSNLLGKKPYSKILYLVRLSDGEVYILDANFDLLKAINALCRELKLAGKEFDKRKLKFKIVQVPAVGTGFPTYKAQLVGAGTQTDEEVAQYTEELIEIAEALAGSYQKKTFEFLKDVNGGPVEPQAEGTMEDFPNKPDGSEDIPADSIPF